MKVSTPIRQKVKLFEQTNREPVHKSLRKVKRSRDKVGPGIQTSIRKFLLKADKIMSKESVTESENHHKEV